MNDKTIIATRQDKTRQDKTRQDKTRQDKTRQVNQIGIIDPNGYELDNRVYSKFACCPTIKAGGARIHTVVNYE